MIEKTSGLVLRIRPLTESSLIVHWLTPNQGRLATVAKGARRPKSPFRGKLDLFYEAEFSFSRSRRSELHTLRELNLRQTHGILRREMGLLQQAAYCSGLVELTTELETPIPGIWRLMSELLLTLREPPPQAQVVFGFEFQLLKELGLLPDLIKSQLSPGSQAVARKLSEASWAVITELKLSPAQHIELRQFLHGFLVYHLNRLPKGRDAALAGSV